VHCKKCGYSVKTGLQSWLDLSIGSKVWEVVTEILAPSFFADEDGIGRFLINMLCAFTSVPFFVGGIYGYMHTPAQRLDNLELTLFGLWYPTLLVWRLLRLRSQSIRNNRDGQIFKW
jgi:hypothetical protein